MTVFDAAEAAYGPPPTLPIVRGGHMTDSPILLDRTRALKDAEAALVAHRLYQQRRVAALPRGATQEQADAWARAWPPTRTTEVEVIVDAVLESQRRDVDARARLDYLNRVLDAQRHMSDDEVAAIVAEIDELKGRS